MFSLAVSAWIGWDDDRVETLAERAAEQKAQASQELENVCRALQGLHTVGDSTDVWARVWGWVGDEYKRMGASEAFRARVADAMREWVKHAVQVRNCCFHMYLMRCCLQEADRHTWAPDTVAKQPWGYFWKQRVASIGMLPCVMWLERSVGIGNSLICG